MGLLENEAPTSTMSDEPIVKPVTKKVDIVDGMAELQSFDKPAHITPGTDLASRTALGVRQYPFEMTKW